MMEQRRKTLSVPLAKEKLKCELYPLLAMRESIAVIYLDHQNSCARPHTFVQHQTLLS